MECSYCKNEVPQDMIENDICLTCHENTDICFECGLRYDRINLIDGCCTECKEDEF